MTARKPDPNCVFCTMPKGRMVFARRLAYAVLDTTPVTPLHMLILPRRHVASYFELTTTERRAIEELLALARTKILADDQTVLGFNIGINVGAVAGQTIFHCHYHLIARRTGDVANPRGGVSAVIPGKADY